MDCRFYYFCPEMTENSKIYRRILRLAAPIALAQLGNMAVQIVDNLMVGAYGGEDPIPLAAVSFATIAWALVFCFCLGLTMALTPIVGKLFVNSEHRECTRYLLAGVVLYTFCGIVACFSMLGFAPLFKYMGQSEQVLQVAIPYYRMLAFAMIPIMIFNSFRQFLEGVGNTAVAMRVIIFSNILNVLLNWMLIFGRLGAPQMGVYGAGLATLLSRVAGPLLIVMSMIIRPRFRIFLRFTFSPGIFGRFWHLLRIGLPIAMQMIFEMSAFTTICFIMGYFGAVPLAANQIADLLGNCSFMVSMSIGSATTIVVSHMYGLKDMDGARKVAKCSARLSLLWGLLVMILFFALKDLTPRMFTQNTEVRQMASVFIMMYGIYQVSDAVQTVMVSVLRALQDVSKIAQYAFFSYIALNIPFACLCAFTLKMGPAGLLMGYILGLSMAAILYSIRVKKNFSRWN